MNVPTLDAQPSGRLIDTYRVFPFNQTKFIDGVLFTGKVALGTSRDGICLAFSWQWLKLLYEKQDKYPSASTRIGAISSFRKLSKTVERHEYANTHLGTNIYTSYGFTTKNVKSYLLQMIPLHWWLEKTFQGACLVFTCPAYQDGNHAIGVFRIKKKGLFGKDRYVVFDANEGEFEVPKAMMGDFLAALLAEYGATMSEHLVELNFLV
ncbi:MAG: hypothetical protein KIS78_05935 [Labilithrix sp.]|nr:hypothetical protein [Labilithrix sp.]